jgi:hypothetical protein
MAALTAALPAVDHVIVDLTARAYDGILAIAEAHAAGRPVLAVGQHDDVALRRRALARRGSGPSLSPLVRGRPTPLTAWLAIDRTAESPA